jgi:hypothetical protein
MRITKKILLGLTCVALLAMVSGCAKEEHADTVKDNDSAIRTGKSDDPYEASRPKGFYDDAKRNKRVWIYIDEREVRYDSVISFIILTDKGNMAAYTELENEDGENITMSEIRGMSDDEIVKNAAIWHNNGVSTVCSQWQENVDSWKAKGADTTEFEALIERTKNKVVKPISMKDKIEVTPDDSGATAELESFNVEPLAHIYPHYGEYVDTMTTFVEAGSLTGKEYGEVAFNQTYPGTISVFDEVYSGYRLFEQANYNHDDRTDSILITKGTHQFVMDSTSEEGIEVSF